MEKDKVLVEGAHETADGEADGAADGAQGAEDVSGQAATSSVIGCLQQEDGLVQKAQQLCAHSAE